MYLSKNWEKAIVQANKEGLTQFCYIDEDKTYFCKWDGIKWSEPVEIRVFGGLTNKL